MQDTPDTCTELVKALNGAPANVPETIAPGDRERFGVHCNNVAHSRITTLRSIFPAAERLVGELFFIGLARAYIEHDPPTSPLLFRYGRGFPEFIAGFTPAASVPYLADVARIEWLRLQAYHAQDATPLAIAVLGQVPEERLPGLVLGLHPSLGLVQSRWPAYSIWAECTEAEAAPPVDMAEAQSIAVLRPELSVETHLLPTGGGVFLAQLAGGTLLGPAAQAAADAVPGFDLSQHLGGVFEIGAVVALDPADAR